ncbi:HAD family hydrolase [Streptomyces sp. NPDC014864]|uniref:HAD family hydrolase n=1 Tax=Streptomyces sp. NPDC014864 TaxID=3364924 RepID=UPI0036FF7827
MQRPLVLFDLDNTLVDRRGAVQEWAAEFTAKHGLGDEGRAYVLGTVATRAYPSTFDVIRTRYNLPMATDELWRAYCADIAASVSCPAEILNGLDELRAAGWRVGIATNGAADIQHAKLQATGIYRRVDGVFISEEGGARKPQTRHFALAAARCGAALGDGGWMVGDNPVNDIGGGYSAGLRTIWVGNGRSWLTDDLTPDHMVPHVHAAIDLLLLHGADQARTTT